MLFPPEFLFAGIVKNISDPSASESLDVVVQILKFPIQQLRECPPDSSFPGAHEADQNNGILAWSRPVRAHDTRPDTLLSLRRFSRTLLQTVRTFLDYFAERFLRWILPLKLRSTTVEETAARPMEPQKALPSLTTKDVCCLG